MTTGNISKSHFLIYLNTLHPQLMQFATMTAAKVSAHAFLLLTFHCVSSVNPARIFNMQK